MSQDSRPTVPWGGPAPTALPPGSRVGKFFRFDRLGAGGMGEVWKAWDPDINRWVALKFVKVEGADDLARFAREAQLAARLTHPNIAAIYEFGEADGRKFIAMQYIEGKTLRHAVRGDRREAARMVRDAAIGVHEAHRLGVIHRDLKPDNIMATTGGHVFVMDFGLARATEVESSISVSGLVVGTPSYMPPEQARGEKVDERADVYSLGATLYELVTGAKPFDAQSVYETLMAVATEDPKAPRSLDPTIDPDLETMILKAIEKEPSRRYRSAADLAADLDRWLKGEPVTARAPSAVYRLKKGFARRRGLLIAIAAGVIASGVTAAVLVPLLRRTEAKVDDEREALLDRLRKTSSLCLEAALEKRRVKDLAGMRSYLGQVKDACDAVVAKDPALAEPHYRLGRLRRVLMDFEGAEHEQSEALRKDPMFGPALYERIVLRSKALVDDTYKLSAGFLRDLGEKLAREGRAAGWSYRPPSWKELLSNTPALRDRITSLRKDVSTLMALDPSRRGDLGQAELLYAGALADWVEGSVDPLPFVKVLKVAPHFLEAWEVLALAWQEQQTQEGIKLAIASLTGGLEQDPGYLPLLVSRGDFELREARKALRRDEETSWAARAEQDFDEALTLDPTNARAYRGRGECRGLRAIKLVDERKPHEEVEAAAMADLRRARDLAPWSGGADAELGRLGSSIARHLSNRGIDPTARYTAVIRELEAGAVRHPEEDLIWIFLGNVRWQLANWLATHGEDPEALLVLAVEAFEQAIRVQPLQQVAYAGRAQARLVLGQNVALRGGDPEEIIARALEDLRGLLRWDAKDADTHLAAGRCYAILAGARAVRGGNVTAAWLQAERSFTEALALMPESTDGLVQRGMTRSRLSALADDPEPYFKSAVEDFTKAIGASTPRSDAYLGRAGVALDRFNFHRVNGAVREELLAEAEKDLTAALAIDPNRDENWRGRGLLRSTWGNVADDEGRDPGELYGKAIEDFTKAIEINKRNEQAWLNRGTTWLNWARIKHNRKLKAPKEWKAALDDLEQVVKVNPAMHPAVREAIEECKTELGRDE